MEAIKEALTFDDVLLLPRFSKVLPSETDISLMFFTFEILLIISLVYLISIPLSFFLYKKQSKRESLETSEEEHEDVL